MAIYVFNLLTGYRFSGVDSGIGKRNKFFKNSSLDVKYVFTQKPTESFIKRYADIGINIDQMMSVHLALANNGELSGNYKVVDKLEELKQRFGVFESRENDEGISLFRNGRRFATMFLKDNKDYFWRISYYESERLVASEFYAGNLLYTDYYVTASRKGCLYAKFIRTSFVDKEGKRIYDYIEDEAGNGFYVFQNGMRCTEAQCIEMFVQGLKLSKDDIVLIDRPASLGFVQPLFRCVNLAKIMVFLHSGHYFEKGEDSSAIYLNYECLYWFKYSYKIDSFLVSTEEQKRDLQEKLTEFNCYVPNIEVAPIGGVNELRIPKKNRRRCSLLTVSRIDVGKRIEWVIASVVEAHKYNSEISLDIYGEGNLEYENYLKKIIVDNHAEEYIRFMGFVDVSEIYQNYEVYISASTFETFGLSVLEAASSGTAIIGLNVRYGNRLFIEHDKNGKLIDFNVQDIACSQKVDEMVFKMANAIVDIFSDEERLRAYQSHSYEIAEQFLDEKIERKWLELFEGNKNI